MVRFFSLRREDYKNVFAEASIRGAFSDGPKCSSCGYWQRRRLEPLIIEWLPGSSLIGDFTWPCSLENLVISDRVKECFEAHNINGFRCAHVTMTQRPGCKPPSDWSRARPRVWLPYTGMPLWSLIITHTYTLNLTGSHRDAVDCPACRHKRKQPDAALLD